MKVFFLLPLVIAVSFEARAAEPTDSTALAGIKAWLALPEADRQTDAPELHVPLSRPEAAIATHLLGQQQIAIKASELKREIEQKSIHHEGKSLRWEEKSFGESPPAGRSLWISMHGGGGAPAAVNDQQWQNQINLYQPAEGIYLAPRAPTDQWNLWHEAHIDPMFQRLIEGHVALRGVDPNKVYLLGYSAGGDGVWQLAPRMADRFAAVAMMAGHPNEASLIGLRNLPFALFMGANDSAYDRNQIAAARAAELDQLEKENPGSYIHLTRIYPGLGHWMNRKDGEALPWMAKFKRNPWPKKIVWQQDDVLHDRFYWLKISNTGTAKAGDTLTASIEGQIICIEGNVPAKTEIRLSDALLDLDREVQVIINGKTATNLVVQRTASNILRTLDERADLPAAATAIIVLP